jgi:uncharacterized membrane protein
MDEPEFNVNDRWNWFIFRYNPTDPDIITYKPSGRLKVKFSINFAHKLAYLYFLLLVIFILMFAILTNSTTTH